MGRVRASRSDLLMNDPHEASVYKKLTTHEYRGLLTSHAIAQAGSSWLPENRIERGRQGVK